MIEFKTDKRGIILVYNGQDSGNHWIWSQLRSYKKATVSRVFHFNKKDSLDDVDQIERDNVDETPFRFQMGSKEGNYHRIPGRIFDIPNDLLIATKGITIDRKTFVAERNISVPGRLAKLIPAGQEIIIGGEASDAIPIELYEEMLAKFPTSLEVDRYARARVSDVLGDYLDPNGDARREYEAYLDRRAATLENHPLPMPELFQSEIDKYLLIRKTIKKWLSEHTTKPEADWQEMIARFLPLIFPKYVKVLQEVTIEDSYSNPGKTGSRRIDIALVDTNGNIDVIEIKRPSEDALLARSQISDNNIPHRRLSATIMQAEKYIFHLLKWGKAGEMKLTARYADDLPDGMEIRITNPKALIIMGRDKRPGGGSALTPGQTFDLEVIKRKYANMVDIITYDDLLRRLDNIISALKLLIEEDEAEPED
ncbi:MAG: DUF4263 domain-containing protein [Rhodobacteraceae bacterium]|nr:DUF4263 domain-containing protein [Paracoccaceae bacterium]